MRKMRLTHVLIVAAIVIATFTAAALSSADTHAKTSPAKTVYGDEKIIPDNEIPLAASPSEAGMNISLAWIIVAVSAVITGVVICEDCRNPH